MLSSPPLRMFGTISCSSLCFQHLLSLPGSHQQSESLLPAGQLATLCHLITSCGCSGRLPKLMIAFIVPGLFTPSFATAEVSTVPGRACEKICHSRLLVDIPEAMISDMRLYWLPTRASMFSQVGCSG